MQVMSNVRDRYKEDIEKNKKENYETVQIEVQQAKSEKEKAIREKIAKGEDTSKEEPLKLSESQEHRINEYNRINVEINSKIEEEIEQELTKLNLDDLRFNQCIATSLPSYIEDPKVKEEDTKRLVELAEFMSGKMLNRIYLDLQGLQRFTPIDSESLGEFLHKFSVNIRYLGALACKFDPLKHPSINLVIQRSIFVRSFKHYLNEAIKSVPSI